MVSGPDITLELPPGTIIQTLTASVDDGVVSEIRVPGEAEIDLLTEGTKIIVRTKTETYFGSFIRQYGNLLMEVEGRLVVIPVQEIVAIELVDPIPYPEEPSDGIKIVISISGEGAKNLTLSYLVAGLSWSQVYDLDLADGRIKAWGIISSFWDFGSVDLSLIVGEPRLIITSSSKAGNWREVALAVPDAGGSYQSVPLGEYHEYHIGQTELRGGEILKLSMFWGEVDLEQFYYWNGGRVEERFNITNTLTEPLGPGRIEFYRDGRWVGEDALQYTSIGEDSTVTVGCAQDVKVEEKVIIWNTGDERDLVTKKIEINNCKDGEISILVERSLPWNGNLIDSTIKPTVEGKLLIWCLEVDNVVEITYQYEILHKH